MKLRNISCSFLIGIIASAGLICQQADSPGVADREVLRKQLVQMFSTELDRGKAPLSEINVSPLGVVTQERNANGRMVPRVSATVTAKCSRDYVFDIERSAFHCKNGALVRIKVDTTLFHSSTGWEFSDLRFFEAQPGGGEFAFGPGPVLPRPTSDSPQNKEAVLRLARSAPGEEVVGVAMGAYASLAFVNVAGTMHLRLVHTHGITDLDCGSRHDGGDGMMVRLGCPGTTEVWVPPDVTRAEVYRLDGTVGSAQISTKGPQRFYRVQPGDQAIVLVRQ
jgi:hypothetical protein